MKKHFQAKTNKEIIIILKKKKNLHPHLQIHFLVFEGEDGVLCGSVLLAELLDGLFKRFLLRTRRYTGARYTQHVHTNKRARTAKCQMHLSLSLETLRQHSAFVRNSATYTNLQSKSRMHMFASSACRRADAPGISASQLCYLLSLLHDHLFVFLRLSAQLLRLLRYRHNRCEKGGRVHRSFFALY